MNTTPFVVWAGETADDLRRHAAYAHPSEACGVVVGRRGERCAQALRVVVGRNLATRPRRFELDPGDLVRFDLAARSRGEEVIAIWHSHPEGSPELSALDQRAALGAWDQVIVAGELGRRARIAWYRRYCGHWGPVHMVSGGLPD